MKHTEGFSSVIVIVLVLVFLGGGIYLYSIQNSDSNNPWPKTTKTTEKKETGAYQTGTKTYSSPSFTIEIPENYTVEEGFNTVTIITPKGDIFVDRIGTEYKSINEHVDNLEELNKVNFKDKELITIHAQEALIAYINFENNNKKNYFILSGPNVYTLTTSSPELFTTLDQIAQTFKYIGD
jgi:hypothetical protein